MNDLFNCFLEKLKMTFLQLTYILWMMTELNRKLPSINYLQDITVIYYFTLPICKKYINKMVFLLYQPIS
jgi:hypothetical protein